MAMVSRLSSRPVSGQLILIIAIVSYLACYLVSNPANIGGLINTASVASSYYEFCNMVSYHGDCDTRMMYMWLISREATLTIPIINVVIIVLLYLTAYRLTTSKIVSGLVSLIYALTPALVFLPWIDQAGIASSSILIGASAMFILLSFVNELALKYLLPGLVLAIVTIGHPLFPVIGIIVGVLALSRYLRGSVNKRIVIANGIVLGLIVTGVAWLGLDSYSFIAIPSIALCAGSLALSLQAKRSTAGVSHKSIAVFIVIIASIILALFILSLGWYKEPSTVLTNPFLMYGLSALLIIPGIVVGFIGSSVEHRYILLALALSISLIIIIDASIYLIATVFFSLISLFILNSMVSIIRGEYLSVKGILRRIAVVSPVILLIVATYAPPLITSTSGELGANMITEISTLAQSYGLMARLDIPEILDDLARAISEQSRTRELLIISDWEYSDIVQGSIARLGLKPRVIASSISSRRDKEIVSRIFTSHWKTALYTIKNMSKSMGIEEVYVLTMFSYTTKMNNSYLGVPVERTLPGETYPRLVFEAFGDLYRFKDYLEYSNRSSIEYIFDHPVIAQQLGPRYVALTWRDEALNTLQVQLVLESLVSIGYSNIYNYNADISPGTQLTPVLEGLEVIYLKNIEMGTVRLTYYGDFTVNYLIAVFKLIDIGG